MSFQCYEFASHFLRRALVENLIPDRVWILHIGPLALSYLVHSFRALVLIKGVSLARRMLINLLIVKIDVTLPVALSSFLKLVLSYAL